MLPPHATKHHSDDYQTFAMSIGGVIVGALITYADMIVGICAYVLSSS